MKRLWIASALLALMLALSLFHTVQVESFAGQLVLRLELAHTHAQSGQWGLARTFTAQAYRDWQANQLYLHTTMGHDDTDAILRAFRSVLQYLALEEMVPYAAANADLVAQLRLLAEMEQASPANVF